MHRFQAGIGRPDHFLLAEVVQLPISRSIEDLLGDLYDKGPDVRQGSDLLVLRLPVEQQWSTDAFADITQSNAAPVLLDLLGTTDIAEAFIRVDDRPVHLLHSFAGQHFFSANINLRFADSVIPPQMPHDEIIEDIQRAEFDHLVERSRAIITAAPGTVFEAPSGRLVSHFVRVGNIQYNRDAVDAVFFWLLPYLKRCAAILTDTWSISSIAFNVATLCQRYFGGGSRRVELLPDYIDATPGSDIKAREIVERLVREAPEEPDLDRILCLISATQSGSLQGTLETIMKGGLGRFQEDYVAIFALGETEMPALRRLVDDNRFQLLQPAADPVQPDHRVPIDRQVYFPLIYKDDLVEITKPVTEPSRGVIDALASNGVLQVHRTLARNRPPRHHGVHVDTPKLINLPAFAVKLTEVLAAIQSRPLLIVAPPGPGGERLVELTARTLRARSLHAPVFIHPTLFFGPEPSSPEARALKMIREAGETDEILVVIDAWVNDASLSQYQRSLRTEGYKGRIHYLVGAACPSSPAGWLRTRRRLTHRPVSPGHEVHTVVDLPLPDWREADCPWCQEVALYKRWARRRALPVRIADRWEKLTAATAHGMSDELFLSVPADTPLKLGMSSFFVGPESSQADAFAAVSSALQRLRTREPDKGPPLGPRRFPISTVLRHGDYLRETWTDSILRSIFLRGAHREELVYADATTETSRTTDLRDLLLDASPAQHDIVLEILLAAALGKATVKVDAALRTGLATIDGDGTIAFFLDMLDADAMEEKARAAGSPLPVRPNNFPGMTNENISDTLADNATEG